MSILSQPISTKPRPFTVTGIRIALLISCAAALSACASNSAREAETQAKANPNATSIEILAPEPVLSTYEVLDEGTSEAAQSPNGGS